jgi:hypothetical protein
MLKPAYGSLYKQMPEGNFWIEKSLIEQLANRGALSITVETALRGHMAVEKR